MIPFILFSLAVVSSLSKVESTTSAVDVCIIGAGPSGIQAAYTLDELGYSTAIFEKESYIGGKTKTITVDGIQYRLGAVFNSHTSLLTPLFKKFNIANPPENIKPTIHIINEKDQSLHKFTIKNPFRFLAALARYEQKQRKFIGLDQPDAYLQPTYSQQQQFLTSFGSWIQKNRLSAIQELFWIWFTTFGYGRVETMPSLYGLKNSHLGTIMGQLGFTHYRGTQPIFQDLLIAMANSLQQGSVYLNTSISNVSYGTTNNVINYKKPDKLGEQQITCGSIIIAFPQITSRMAPVFIPPTLSIELKNLTEQVKIVDYYTVLYATDPSKMTKFNKNERVTAFVPRGSSGTIPEGNLLYAKLHPIANASVVAYYLSESPKTNKQVQQLSLESYKKLAGYTAANDTIVQSFDKWDYFPHVSSESIKDGFYDKFKNEKQTNIIQVHYLLSNLSMKQWHMLNI